ncbi:MAG: molybdopterin-dependent oxidoreductase [Nocardioidaceae bacterium]
MTSTAPPASADVSGSSHARFRWWYGALGGVLSAALGLGVSEVLSGWLHQRVSPVVAVAESIIQITPGAVIERVISLVGHDDKPLVIASTLVGLTVISALVGVVSSRSLALAELVFLAMGVVLVLAVDSRLSDSSSRYLPAVVGVGVAMVTLSILAPRAVAVSRRPSGGRERAAALDRRHFLGAAGAVAVLAAVTIVAGRTLAQSRQAVDAARTKLAHTFRRLPTPAGVDLGIAGVANWVTPQSSFYRVDTALSVPEILPQDWRLRVHGMVDREISVTYQDLLDRGLHDFWLTLCCVSNEVGGNLISNACWSGVPVADILAEAGVHPSADAVQSTSSDGWTAGTPLGALTDGRNAMLALAMNGQPLTPEHGFPVRMVVPGLYGYVSATKWLVDLNVTRFSDFSAFWSERGWSPLGPVKTESRIDVPRNGDSLAVGRVAIGGVAWAQHTGIRRVEVHIDDHPWVTAKLGTDPTTDSWRQWVYVWDATAGTHQIQVRATDESGYTQTHVVQPVVPNGATGWDTIDVHVS